MIRLAMRYSLERVSFAGDNVTYRSTRCLQTLQATKKQDNEPDTFPSSCRHRIEESRG